MAYMRERVLSKWMGKKEEQEWVCSPEGMRHCYEATQRRHSLSRGDFPNPQTLSQQLRTTDFNDIYKPSCALRGARAREREPLEPCGPYARRL